MEAVNGSPRYDAENAAASVAAALRKPGIYGFFGEHRFLSNFHPAKVELDGLMFPTTEHAYQAAKVLDLEAREVFQTLATGREARQLGQRVQCRPDWEEVKYSVMYDLNCQKFATYPLSVKLMNTGTLYLEETNTWGDKYWGVCNGVGQNNLGKMLMAIRDDLFAIQEQRSLDALGR